tara:strand:- start:11 stop:421 length:411 start_codon:yes stop_codon:yes gene_type:complete
MGFLSICWGIFIFVGIYGWIISVNNTDLSLACKNDVVWIKVFSVLVLGLVGLSLVAASSSSSVAFALKQCSGIVVIAWFSWQCYGIQIFFKQPICKTQAVHLFGMVFSYIFIVVGACGFCLVCCGGFLAVFKLGGV